ncbi:glycosyltransferase family 9 protein [Phenylobacterium sp. SCN 70-31]|uniref:glycosyltransferase family 9 protein n=1 Tax=Phenylobacterium sp. SCN 70-31 TaxID=1660129 RepID=UPI000A7A4061
MSPWHDIRLGYDLLVRGEFNDGFRLLDRWRELPERSSSRAPALPLRRWKGGPVPEGRLLVWGEEGYGDQIMYARFGRLAPVPDGVLWMSPPPLVRLFRECGGFEVSATDQPVRLDNIASYCPSSALPLAFDLSAGIPNLPYFTPPPAKDLGARIGVVTSGNPKHANDTRRSLDPASAARLMSLRGAISLQPWDTGAQDFYETAQIIAGLQLVISVDTAIAHLAGAMGCPVWILVTHHPDWRWGSDGETSLWYPSARLFRQREADTWHHALDEVEAALELAIAPY